MTLQSSGKVASKTHSCPGIFCFFVSVKAKGGFLPASIGSGNRTQGSKIEPIASWDSSSYPTQFLYWDNNCTTGQNLCSVREKITTKI